MNRQKASRKKASMYSDRSFFVTAFFVVIGLVFVGRLFSLQIIEHDKYVSAARQDQFKRLEIQPERGTISVLDGEVVVPLVVNQTKFLVLADPALVKDPEAASVLLAAVLGTDQNELKAKLSKKTRYEILAKKVGEVVKEKVAALDMRGIVIQQQRVRAYPAGQFASHILGFVNDDSQGQYGVEGFLDETLAGIKGQVKAVTDVQGVPLVQNDDNIVKAAVSGRDVVLSIDQTMQRIAEEEIKTGVEQTKAKSGSVIVMEAHTGKVKAMANFPTYDVSKYAAEQNAEVYKNRVVSEPIEPGSIMKTLTVSAALDQNLINKDSTYYDPGAYVVDGFKITNAIDFGTGQFTIFDILKNSLNTGAVYLEQQMGGGELNEKARLTWHSYLTDKYHFGSKTGVEIQEEEAGFVPSPTEGDGRNIQYANTSFGQGISLSAVQMASAVSAVVNGGTYYKPSIVEGYMNDGVFSSLGSKVVTQGTISAFASKDIAELMKRYSESNNKEALRDGFVVGGKTGTAQVAKQTGGYREDIFNATFVGYVGVARPEYVIVLHLDEGQANGDFTGGKSARPVFTAIIQAMMNSVSLAPRVK